MVKNSICERSLRLAFNRNGGLTGGLYKEYLEMYYHVHGEICKHSKKQLLAYVKEGGNKNG